jgi:hypothetical protein
MTLVIDALTVVLHRPDPAALVALQEAVLVEHAAMPARARVLASAREFFAYLSTLQGKLTAREYSQVASWLDISAVGVVAFEEAIKGQMSGLRDLLIGLAAEGLMVAASRQYVKAWDAEARLVHGEACWFVREALWEMSEDLQPELSPAARQDSIRSLLAPILADATPPQAKIVLLSRLFQVLLVLFIAQLSPPIA